MRELGDGRGARLARKRIDERNAPARLFHRQSEHTGRGALSAIASGSMRLLGRDIRAFHLRNLVARKISAAFHRPDLSLCGRQVVAQHCVLFVAIGDELGERRVSRGFADHARGLELSVVRAIAIALVVPGRALQHHVIGLVVAECAPLHQILGEGSKAVFSGLPLTEIAVTKRPERVLFRELVDGGCRRIGAHGALCGGIAEVAMDQGRGEATQFPCGIDAAHPECRTSGHARSAFIQIGSRGSETAIGPKSGTLAEVTETG